MDKDIIKKIRKDCLEISYLGRDGNLQSVFSALDIMWVLYDSVVYKGEDKVKRNNTFVLSKGQASLGLYVILAEKGILSLDEVKTFCKFNSRFGMQIDRTKFNEIGIEISAGSLGHGFPIAVGMSMALKIQNSSDKVFVLVGDGEFNEGTMWESALLASAKKLDNLCIIIDDNNSIGKMLDMGDMKKKLEAFGFEVRKINGHSHNEILKALSEDHFNKPLAIIAKTIRGYGCESMMRDIKWFHRSPNLEELNILIEEVEKFEKTYV